jgi:hypothetical protein
MNRIRPHWVQRQALNTARSNLTNHDWRRRVGLNAAWVTCRITPVGVMTRRQGNRILAEASEL